MAEFTSVSDPVSAANQRDPSFMTRMPRRAGFHPPLMVAEFRFWAVRRVTWAAAGMPAGGSGPMNCSPVPSAEAPGRPAAGAGAAVTLAEPTDDGRAVTTGAGA